MRSLISLGGGAYQILLQSRPGLDFFEELEENDKI